MNNQTSKLPSFVGCLTAFVALVAAIAFVVPSRDRAATTGDVVPVELEGTDPVEPVTVDRPSGTPGGEPASAPAPVPNVAVGQPPVPVPNVAVGQPPVPVPNVAVGQPPVPPVSPHGDETTAPDGDAGEDPDVDETEIEMPAAPAREFPDPLPESGPAPQPGNPPGVPVVVVDEVDAGEFDADSAD